MTELKLDAESSVIWHLLTENKLASEDQLQEIYDEHVETGKPFIEVLLNYGIISEEELLSKIAENLGSTYIDVKAISPTKKLIKKLSAPIARMYGIIPVKEENEVLYVVAKDPMDYKMMDELSYVIGQECVIMVGKPSDVDAALDNFYPEHTESVDDILSEFDGMEEVDGDDDFNEAELEDMASDAPIVRFVDVILYQAVSDQASDVHFEPFRDEFRIRYRIDGALYEMPPPPKHLAVPVISRIKVLSGLDISERRIPQDGRIELRISGKPIDLRVSTLPTVYGESVVLRVLDRSVVNLSLDSLGFDEIVLTKLKEIIRTPNGVIAVTGPTGSGKTTTLYSSLKDVNAITEKLLTAEDPVEYDLEGIMQVPVKDSVGMTFAAALKAFLRQDPDIIMIGEIRDIETAGMAIRAALTGHLVFSTLHTSSAAGTVTRLVDMGVEPFLVCSSLIAVLGQRLVRRVCRDCKTTFEPTEDDLDRLDITTDYVGDNKFAYGKGCTTCSNSGYKGRRGIYELLVVTNEIRELVNNNAPTAALREKAQEQGMSTLREDGVKAIILKDTTIEEILKYT
ncbi:MAG: ATPase, T2SS/T4P/T4SS family [Verrucomicrobiota bacterium]|nr:ATPase, T2SS/T4P/T4SS family [Verrucomicrobiota bacterium]